MIIWLLTLKESWWLFLIRKLDKQQADNLTTYNKPKQQNVMLAKCYDNIGMHKHAQYVRMCSVVLRFIADTTKSHRMLIDRYSCKDRFCPIDQKIQARKNDYKLLTFFNYLDSKKTRAGKPRQYYLFLTPTIPNVAMTPKAVRNAFYKIQHAVSRLLHRTGIRGWGKYKDYSRYKNGKIKKFVRDSNGNLNLSNTGKIKKIVYHSYKGFVTGALVKHECTVNTRSWTVNVHVHIILTVKPSYKGKNYLNYKQWRKLWESALGTTKFRDLFIERPYFKLANGKKVRLSDCDNPKQIHKALHHASKEMSKYETKSQDFSSILKHSPRGNHKKLQQVFDALYLGLKNTRTYYYYGVFYFLNRQWRKGNLFDYEPSTRNNWVYEYDLTGKYHFKDKIYHSRYQKFNDSRIRYIRVNFGVKTIPTSLEQQGDNDLDCGYDRNGNIIYYDTNELRHMVQNPATAKFSEADKSTPYSTENLYQENAVKYHKIQKKIGKPYKLFDSFGNQIVMEHHNLHVVYNPSNHNQTSQITKDICDYRNHRLVVSSTTSIPYFYHKHPFILCA